MVQVEVLEHEASMSLCVTLVLVVGLALAQNLSSNPGQMKSVDAGSLSAMEKNKK